MSDSTESFIASLFASTHQVVLKASPQGFQAITPITDWYRQYIYTENPLSTILDSEKFPPFLQHFFVDASALKDEPDGSQISSGVWQESTESGSCYFTAKAIKHLGLLILLIEKLGDEFDVHRGQMQIARENILLSEQLEKLVSQRTAEIRLREEEIILRLLAAAGARDDETNAHVKRIGLYSATVATKLGWRTTETDDLRLAAQMHDIGKIGIPDRVLLKPGKLSPAEWVTMRMHPTLGAKMLGGSQIPMLKLAASISLCHHERYDGTGYPAGLQGKDIPMSARIVAIVDVYDALINKRIYKEAIPEKQALKMMKATAGKHLDKDVLHTFMSCLNEIKDIRLANQDNPALKTEQTVEPSFTDTEIFPIF